MTSPEQLVERARRHEDPVPDGARDRVWRSLRRAQGETASRRGWPLVFAGAALAGTLILLVLPRLHTAPPAFAAGTTLADSAREALVELPGVGQLVVGPHARVTVQRFDDREVDLRVDAGTLLVHVLPRQGRGPFVVKTPRFVARVVGTVFSVAVAPSGDSRIAVAHGTVEVTPDGKLATLVHAREAWPRGAVVTPSADELALLTDHEQVTLEDFTLRPPHLCEGDAEARVRCEVAFAHEAPPSEAENALYRAGLTAWHELDDPQRALALWRHQRERFPNGALRREAQASMIDALVATRSVHEAENAIESYLAVEPDDLRAPELHFVLGTILHQLDGSCRRASAELDLALAHPVGPWVEQAKEARRACSRAR